MTEPAVQPYRPTDAAGVVELWNASLSEPFRIREPLVHQLLERDPSHRPADAVVARADGRPVGFGYVGRYRGEHDEAAMRDLLDLRGLVVLQAVVVHPDRRRRGLGARIVGSLLEAAGDGDRATVQVGGGTFYLWPGVPLELADARAFLGALGFEEGSDTYDLRGEVTALEADAAHERVALDGLELGPADARDRDALLDFLLREFGGEWWHDTRWFLDEGGDPADVLLLRDPRASIVGLVRLHTPATNPVGPPHFWAGGRGPKAGGLGPIGIAAALRGTGLGRALLVAALDRLREMGLTDVVIDYTTLLDFYGPVGFRPWITYRHASAPLDRVVAATRAVTARSAARNPVASR